MGFRLNQESTLARWLLRLAFLDRKALGRFAAARHEGRPGLAGFRAVLGGSARNGRNANEMMATRTLNFASRELFVALQVLLAFGAGELHFVHRIALWLNASMIQTRQRCNSANDRLSAIAYWRLPIGYSRKAKSPRARVVR